MTQKFDIAGRPIGPDHPPFIIAELSANHNGSLDKALTLVDAAAEAGADAIKLQTYTPDTITLKCDRPEFRLAKGPWAGRTLHDLYAEAMTPWEWHAAIFQRASERGLTAFSSPFDPTAVAYLEELEVPAFKIASFEIVDTPLIARAGQSGKPLIISTGLADLGEIERAVGTAREMGVPFALLHCISSYPAPAEDSNLLTMPHLSKTFGCPVGLSDHTEGHAVAVAAVALGASIIEKHLTLARADGGPDADFSMEPDEFATLVQASRTAWLALGAVDYGRKPSEEAASQTRRSLYVVEDIAAGATLTEQNIRSIRPGQGLAPHMLPTLLGRKAARDLKRGEPLRFEMIAEAL